MVVLTQGKDETTVAIGKSPSCLSLLHLSSPLTDLLDTAFFLTLVCSGDKVETFPVLSIDPKDIVDTNGAGDAFVGGREVESSKIKKCFPFFVLGCARRLSSPCFARFPVRAGSGEAAGQMREGRSLRRQRHHPTGGLHLPREAGLQLRGSPGSTQLSLMVPTNGV